MRSVTGKAPANAFIPQGPPLTHESRRCLTYLFIQQRLIKQVFSAKSSVGLRAQQRSEVPLVLTLLNEPASCFALISHPSPNLPGANHTHLRLSLQQAKLPPISGLLCLLFHLPRASQDGFIHFLQLKDTSLLP